MITDNQLKNSLCNNDIEFLETYKDQYNINHCFIDEDEDSLLLYAISDGGSEVYQYLLDRGADIFYKNILGENILHAVVFSNDILRLNYLLQKYPDVISLLNIPDNNGTTPLFYSIMMKKKYFLRNF
ncbi:hypothetical protein BKH41_02175 [Helicobacter sp. 12S02232-10]|uniref:ankyrin repeat domain-containing protein n=1 Tax=Helicobacter sp. 12S02232-10 TaxID=1476197 RepID=UPI000BA682E5|nr:ankyrin repeat domain-containing protein [Helicobacter sp. 12S02232-10]PAF49494.1 hypothetical protein BKH41_02175 [Helicobacter sp. 12S02232-10]